MLRLLLMLRATQDASLFGTSAVDRYGCALSPYDRDEIVDEQSLYLVKRTRREEDTMAAPGGESGYGSYF